MQLHTFRARSLAAALRLVRDELGPEASVLHTRDVSSPVARWWGARTIEVTASAEIEAPSRLPTDAPPLVKPSPVRPAARVPAADLHDFRRQFRSRLAAADETEASLVERLAEPRLAAAVTRLPGGQRISKHLRERGVSDATSNRWLERLAAELSCDPQCDGERVWDRLQHIVASEVAVQGPFQLAEKGPRIIALVGPTGVGKTTTLAKLAAHFRLHERRRVALLTGDTFRIAATLQLQTYAEIMDLPMEVVATGGEMADAVGRLSQFDVLLIDTAGASPADQQGIRAVQALLAAAAPHEVALVLSCTADAASMKSAADALAAVGTTNLILTKLDETPRPGALADGLAACRLPVSYLTHGQEVPADIEPASAQRLAELILGRSAAATYS